ncbi:MAG: hypothetical protein WDN49_16470 [Acetobacteraceae bacterium]
MIGPLALPGRRFFAALLATSLGLGAPPLLAEDTGPAGRWQGAYICAQGLTALEVTIEQAAHGRLRALFHFSAAPSNPLVPEGCFLMDGRYDPASRTVTLDPGDWLLQPEGFVTVGLSGVLDATGRVLSGNVTLVPLCTTFTLSRTQAAPALPAPCRWRGLVASAE